MEHVVKRGGTNQCYSGAKAFDNRLQALSPLTVDQCQQVQNFKLTLEYQYTRALTFPYSLLEDERQGIKNGHSINRS